MGDADVDVVLRTIKDPATVYLWQHLTRGGVDVFDPPDEIPSGPEFIHQLPERTWWAEETAFISEIFDHAAQAHKHLSSVRTNISALAKITNRATLHTIINGAVWPLVQINIPEGFLNPVEDRRPKTTEEERWEKVWKMVLPTPNTPCLAHEPKNGPTHILAVAVWLKLNCKYFNEGTAKEVCVTGSRWGQNSCPECWWGGSTLVVHRQRNARPQKNLQSKERRPTLKEIWQRWHNIMVHMAKNNCKSVPAQIHHSTSYHQVIRHLHPIPVQAAQGGICKLLPLYNHPQPPPPSPTMCDRLSHKVDPNSLSKIVHFDFY